MFDSRMKFAQELGYAGIAEALEDLERLRKLQQGAGGWVLKMLSGVSGQNDNVIGVFNDYATAMWVGKELMEMDKKDCPEYFTFTVTDSARTGDAK